MTVPAAGEDHRIAVYGAVDYATGRVVWQMASKQDGAGFAAFLEQLAQAWPEEDLVLVLDNVSYHRSAPMRIWWAAQVGRMLPFWLPAYAPNLNLLERVWRFLKQKLACHRFWSDREGLRGHAEGPPVADAVIEAMAAPAIAPMHRKSDPCH